MNVWLISIFENTPLDDNLNTRFNCIVNECIHRGHTVTFWSSTFRHNSKKQRYDSTYEITTENSCDIIYVKAKAYKRNISFKRSYSHYILGKDLIKEFEKKQSLPDVILVAFPPISTAYEVILWSNKKEIPVIIDIIDPWPYIFEQQLRFLPKWLRTLIFTTMNSKVKTIIKKSSAITAISNQYLDWANTYSKITNTNCFYPAVDYDLVQSQRSMYKSTESNIFTVVYAGSLGFSYDLKTIINAAKELESESSIKFIICGDGPQRSMLEKASIDLSNLEFLGRIPKEKLIEIYTIANVGLTQHIKGATQSVTYKLFDLLSNGLPIINSLESEMWDIIEVNKVGYNHEPGDFKKLASYILELKNNNRLYNEMVNNAHKLTIEQGDSTLVYKKFVDLIEQLN